MPVAVLIARTLAEGMRLPCSSVTVPFKEVRATCAVTLTEPGRIAGGLSYRFVALRKPSFLSSGVDGMMTDLRRGSADKIPGENIGKKKRDEADEQGRPSA
jgi:hypothetical protein